MIILKKELLECMGVISRKELKRNSQLRRRVKNLEKRLMMIVETGKVTGRASMLKYIDGKALLKNQTNNTEKK